MPTSASFVDTLPPASAMPAVGLERSIVVEARRPRCVPGEHEFRRRG